MTYEKVTAGMLPCPQCGHIAAHFIPRKLNRAVIGEQWFAAMRAAVDSATTPEIDLEFASDSPRHDAGQRREKHTMRVGSLSTE